MKHSKILTFSPVIISFSEISDNVEHTTLKSRFQIKISVVSHFIIEKVGLCLIENWDKKIWDNDN